MSTCSIQTSEFLLTRELFILSLLKGFVENSSGPSPDAIEMTVSPHLVPSNFSNELTPQSLDTFQVEENHTFPSAGRFLAPAFPRLDQKDRITPTQYLSS